MDCPCVDGWVCEDHPAEPMNHDGCGGAGAPCLNPACPRGRENIARRPIDEQITRERYPELFDT